MKRVLVVGLVLGLLAGSLIGPAEAKKKKKKKPPAPPAASQPVPVDVTFYLRNESTGCAAADLQLRTVDGPDTSSCGSAFSGAINEILARTGGVPGVQEGPGTIVYTAADGVPFTLNASKEITGMIGVRSYRGAAANPLGLSGGPTTLVLQLTGSINGGDSKLIAETKVDYSVLPSQQLYEVKFTMKPDAALDKAQVSSLQLSLYNRGVAPLHGFYTTENPASNFTIGTFQPPPA